MMEGDTSGITAQSTPFVDDLLDVASAMRPIVLKAILILVFGCLLAVAPGVTRWVVVALVMVIIPGILDLRGRLLKAEARSREVEVRSVETEKERAWACAALRIAMTRVEELKAELVAACRRPGGATSDPVYRSVGLDADAPDYIVAAARRAHRVTLHPDKQPPEERRAAHDRYVAVEAAFDEIARRRGA